MSRLSGQGQGHRGQKGGKSGVKWPCVHDNSRTDGPISLKIYYVMPIAMGTNWIDFGICRVKVKVTEVKKEVNRG